MTIEEKEEFEVEVTRIVNAVLEFANFTQPFLKGLQFKITPSIVRLNFTCCLYHSYF